MQSDHSTLNKPTDFEFINEQALYQRGLRERVFHAVLFEVLGIAFATPLAMWMTQKPALSMAALSAVISGMAMFWNMVFNWIFDVLQRKYHFRRNVWIRIVHACCFEIGLIIMVVPLVAWWVNTTLWHALVVDIGLVLFFLPYSFFYNLIYDKVRLILMKRRSADLDNT
ncbi:MAG TPA: PACE efflux transporter [Paenalcaligenes sp.]|nr:PACE efflux transporter [Paenalcaligenes sp.]